MGKAADCGPGNSDGIATDYGPGKSDGIKTDFGLGSPGIESLWWARFFALPDRPCSPPSLLYNGCRVFARGKVRLRRAADHSLPSSAAVMEE